MATKQDTDELKLAIQELGAAIEKMQVDVKLIISKGNEKHLKLTLAAVTCLTVFCGVLIHFS